MPTYKLGSGIIERASDRLEMLCPEAKQGAIEKTISECEVQLSSTK